MTPTSHTTADQVREMGLGVGDVIVGRETWGSGWSESELTLLFVGQTVAVFNERYQNSVRPYWQDGGETATWTLVQRDWIIQTKGTT